jgi:hypothetical protein
MTTQPRRVEVVFREILFAASLIVASSAPAQTPERTSSTGIPDQVAVKGLGHAAVPTVRSFFRAELRGDLATSAFGEAEFGAIRAIDGSSDAFVVSLGVCGHQGAVLFTRRSGTPLGVGRYRISEAAEGGDEILALVLPGSATRPTGAFRGQSGWLVITAASDRLITGRFQLDAIGLLGRREDRHVSVTGLFSATAGTSSLRVCQDAE